MRGFSNCKGPSEPVATFVVWGVVEAARNAHLSLEVTDSERYELNRVRDNNCSAHSQSNRLCQHRLGKLLIAVYMYGITNEQLSGKGRRFFLDLAAISTYLVRHYGTTCTTEIMGK